MSTNDCGSSPPPAAFCAQYLQVVEEARGGTPAPRGSMAAPPCHLTALTARCPGTPHMCHGTPSAPPGTPHPGTPALPRRLDSPAGRRGKQGERRTGK